MLEKTHICSKTPMMANMEWKKNRGMHGEGFVLTLFERKVEGKLSPKSYNIKVDVDYCPFCGEKLEIIKHNNFCKCIKCELNREFTGI